MTANTAGFDTAEGLFCEKLRVELSGAPYIVLVLGI